MKRSILVVFILLLILLFLNNIALSAGAIKESFILWNIDYGEEDAGGFAIINFTPKDHDVVGVIIEVQVWNLLPKKYYALKIYNQPVSYLFTDEEGCGSFHLNLLSDEVFANGIQLRVTYYMPFVPHRDALVIY